MATLTMNGYTRMRATPSDDSTRSLGSLFDEWLRAEVGTGQRIVAATFSEGVMRAERYKRVGDDGYDVIRDDNGKPVGAATETHDYPLVSPPPEFVFNFCE